MNDNMIRHDVDRRRVRVLPDRRARGRRRGPVHASTLPRAVRPRRAPGAPAADAQPVQLETRARLPLRARLRQVRRPRQEADHLGGRTSPPASASVRAKSIPRDTKYPGFTNLLIEPNVGANMRFFLAKWLTVNFGIRDYMFVDKFEPTNRSPTMNATASTRQDARRQRAHQQPHVPGRRQLLAADLVRVHDLPLIGEPDQ